MSPPTLSSSRAELQHTLCFVLQHSDVCHDIKALCSLLSVSISCASSVHASCAGCSSLTVATDLGASARFRDGLVPVKPGVLQWLAKHAVLLRQLQQQFQSIGGDFEESQRLAAAVGAAGSLPEGLKLQSLSTNSLPLLTAAAPCSSLTQVQLQLDPQNLGFGRAFSGSATGMQQAVAAVTGLGTQLRRLQLSTGLRPAGPGWLSPKEEWFGSFLQQALPKLTALTGLHVEGVHDSCVLHYAPAELVELECNSTENNREGDPDRPLDLRHLTACTALNLGRKYLDLGLMFLGWRDIKAIDSLPPNLQRLSILDCQSTTPLLPLSQLTELSMSRSSTLASELSRLSTLTSLQKVVLQYVDRTLRGRSADSAAAAWGCVPGLRELMIDGQQIDPHKETLECLGKLTGLTRLEWASSYVHKRPEVLSEEIILQAGWEEVAEQPEVVLPDAGLHRLAAALPTSLRELTLEQFVSGSASNEPAMLFGFKALMQAVRALPCLVLHTVQDECEHCWSPAGKALFVRIQAGEEVESGELQYFATELWSEDEPVYVDDSEGDVVCSDDVSVEVMAADPVSEEYGGVYDDDEAVWEGDAVEEVGPV